MASSITINFDAEEEAATGNGWTLSYDDGTGTINRTDHLTATAAWDAGQDVLSADPDIQSYFYQTAVNDFIAANQATVDTNTETLRTGEGLDAT